MRLGVDHGDDFRGEASAGRQAGAWAVREKMSGR